MGLRSAVSVSVSSVVDRKYTFSFILSLIIAMGIILLFVVYTLKKRKKWGN